MTELAAAEHGQAIVHTVTGPVPSAALGLTLPHEHLYFDFSADAQPDDRFPELFDGTITATDAWKLRESPYCSRDNMRVDDDELIGAALTAFAAVGGRTVIDVTPAAIGRRPERLREASERSGVRIVMGAGFYMEDFHDEHDRGLSADDMVATILADFAETAAVRPGVLGEIGVSPAFTDWERRSLRAAAIAQRQLGVPLYVHIPSWERLGHEVLDVVLAEDVQPGAVVLCHLDASGTDAEYQLSLAARGARLEFDMIGMPYWLTGEGQCPTPDATAAAIATLVDHGHSSQLLLSHDLWLKSMHTEFGGNGLTYVPVAFGERLERAGVSAAEFTAMTTTNVRDLFDAASRS